MGVFTVKCLDARVYTRMSLCVDCYCTSAHWWDSEVGVRCGLCEFLANDGLRKSDSPVNVLSVSHNTQDYRRVCVWAGWIL